MTGSQGLVSVLHRNSATRRYCFGFIARHITGVQRLHWAFTRCPSFPTGAEPFARKERYLMPTLFYPGRGNSSVPLIRNPIGSLGGHSASRLSLCPCGRSPTMAGRTTGCLSAPVV